MGKRFQDKVVWITGGGSGIGKALALEFVRQGAKVAVSGRREAKLQEVVAEIEKIGGQGLGVVCDVTSDESIQEAVKKVVDHFGKMDVSVANAGFGIAGTVEQLTMEDWHRQFNTNVFGLALTAKYSLPELRRNKGRMVLMGSVAGCVTVAGNSAYHSSKYAVRSIGQALSLEVYGTGVSCTTIQPGFVESEIGKVDREGVYQENWVDRRPKAVMWTSEKAARVCIKAIYKRKREFTFTGHGKFAVFMGNHFPGTVHFIMSRFGGNTAKKFTKDVKEKKIQIKKKEASDKEENPREI